MQPKYPIEEERVDSWEAPGSDRPVFLCSVRVNRPGRAASAAQANKNYPGQHFGEINMLISQSWGILPYLAIAQMPGASDSLQRESQCNNRAIFLFYSSAG